MFNSLLNRLTRRKLPNPDETRLVHINDRPNNSGYSSNRISNTKYTILTFLPKNLLEQFGRFMNIYFLFIACLQLSPVLAPVNPATTWVPLTLIFAISAFKEAVDDYHRYQQDKTANMRKYWMLSPNANGKVQIHAEDIRVGDLIYLRENDEVPCDLVILKTADADTHCAYIQTANLDGETDLKTRNAVRATALMSEEELLNLRGTIECANPNAEIYKFDSRLKISSRPIENGSHLAPIASEDGLLPPRASSLTLESKRSSIGDSGNGPRKRNIRASVSGYPPSNHPETSSANHGTNDTMAPQRNATHNARPGHRRAISSGRNPAFFADEVGSASPSNASNTADRTQVASLTPEHPALPRRAISGNLTQSLPAGHRRARSLGGNFLFEQQPSQASQARGVDETSPYFIPDYPNSSASSASHKRVGSRAASDEQRDFDERRVSVADVAIPLDPSHTAWQATTIRNVAWVVGVAVYTGNETKVGMNKSVPPSKWTKVDSIINRATIAVFIMQIILTLLLGITGDFWVVYNTKRHWYLSLFSQHSWNTWLIIPLRFLLLMSLMIPISLKVSLDAVKYVYAMLIDWDLDMVDPESQISANCNSSALAEDLGQIDYIFSDKTGTLTENVMVFAQCSINHTIYDGAGVEPEPIDFGEDDEDDENVPSGDSHLEDSSDSKKSSKKKKKKKKKDAEKEKGETKASGKKLRRPTAATDPNLRAMLAERNALAYDFCRILALCNTAMPTTNEDDCIVWKCASPDEEALVVAAAELGFTLRSSRADELTLEIDPTGPCYSQKLATARRKSRAFASSSPESPAHAASPGKKSASSSNENEDTANELDSSTSVSTSTKKSPKKVKPASTASAPPRNSSHKHKNSNTDDESQEKKARDTEAGESPEDPSSAMEVSETQPQAPSSTVTERFMKFMKKGVSSTSKKTREAEDPNDSSVATKDDDQPKSDDVETEGVENAKKKKKKKRVRIALAEDDVEIIVPTVEDSTSNEDEDDDSSPKTTEKYTVLHILEFTSDRKRMSVLLRSHTTNQLVLLMKGADDKVLAALAAHQHKKEIIADVEHFAQLGLRTLCLCQREVSESEYAKWSIKLNKAATAMKDREALVAEAYAEIERDFQFVGITAIEDKLQQGVPETIELLRRAGIKIWMLTGDKLATAVQIATSCNLINPTSVLAGEVFTIEGKTFDSALASLNATIAKVLPLTRGMGATTTASSTGVRLNSYFDQPQAYKYQHLALKTAAQADTEDDLSPLLAHDSVAIDMERTLNTTAADSHDDTQTASIEGSRTFLLSTHGGHGRNTDVAGKRDSSSSSTPRRSRPASVQIDEDTLKNLKSALAGDDTTRERDGKHKKKRKAHTEAEQVVKPEDAYRDDEEGDHGDAEKNGEGHKKRSKKRKPKTKKKISSSTTTSGHGSTEMDEDEEMAHDSMNKEDAERSEYSEEEVNSLRMKSVGSQEGDLHEYYDDYDDYYGQDGMSYDEDAELVEFQEQQYYQQYHDQQFHVPSLNPNTKLLPHRTMAGVATGAGGKRELSLVIEGATLTHLLRPACKARFLQLALEAHTVICCRVTPQQKGQVVELVKHGVSGVSGGKQERTTLAIGDGGNDVSMIQAASVGVGLVGREGLQAARASDFSLAKFRFLAKLVLVHGRWSYRRTSFVAHYCFHKSLFLAFMQIFYAFFTGFSGSSLFDSFALASYNVAFTGLPIMFYSLDKDINEQNLLLNPQLYHETQSGRFLNTFTLLYWFVRSFVQSALVFFCVTSLSHAHTSNGFASDWISMSNMAYGACVVVQCLTIFLESNQLTFINHIVIWGTLGLYFANMLLIDVAIPVFNGVVIGLFSDPIFWFGLLLAVSAAILPIVALKFLMITWFPTRSQLVQRMEALDVTEYQEFAISEQRRREGRASYIQESHQVASLVKKKPPTAKRTNFLLGTIYKIQAAAAARQRGNTEENANADENTPRGESQEDEEEHTTAHGRRKDRPLAKHPSTLHRTTPVTPEVLSSDDEDHGNANNVDDLKAESDGGVVAEDYDSDEMMTMSALMHGGHPVHITPSPPSQRLNKSKDNLDINGAALQTQTGQFVASTAASSSGPVPSSSSPPNSGKTKTIIRKHKSKSVDRTSKPDSQTSTSYPPRQQPHTSHQPSSPTTGVRHKQRGSVGGSSATIGGGTPPRKVRDSPERSGFSQSANISASGDSMVVAKDRTGSGPIMLASPTPHVLVNKKLGRTNPLSFSESSLPPFSVDGANPEGMSPTKPSSPLSSKMVIAASSGTIGASSNTVYAPTSPSKSRSGSNRFGRVASVGSNGGGNGDPNMSHSTSALPSGPTTGNGFGSAGSSSVNVTSAGPALSTSNAAIASDNFGAPGSSLHVPGGVPSVPNKASPIPSLSQRPHYSIDAGHAGKLHVVPLHMIGRKGTPNVPLSSASAHIPRTADDYALDNTHAREASSHYESDQERTAGTRLGNSFSALPAFSPPPTSPSSAKFSQTGHAHEGREKRTRSRSHTPHGGTSSSTAAMPVSLTPTAHPAQPHHIHHHAHQITAPTSSTSNTQILATTIALVPSPASSTSSTSHNTSNSSTNRKRRNSSASNSTHSSIVSPTASDSSSPTPTATPSPPTATSTPNIAFTPTSASNSSPAKRTTDQTDA